MLIERRMKMSHEALSFLLFGILVCFVGGLLAVRESSGDTFVFGILVSGMLALCITFFGPFSFVEKPTTLQKDTVYNFVSAHYGSPKRSIILELKQENWNGVYLFKVACNTLRGGCPSEWPDHFEIVKSARDLGAELIIVPVEVPKESGSTDEDTTPQ